VPVRPLLPLFQLLFHLLPLFPPPPLSQLLPLFHPQPPPLSTVFLSVFLPALLPVLLPILLGRT
jgi:hypothetical protein